MPSINVKSTTHLPADDTYSRVKQFLSDNKEIKNFDSEFKLIFDDSKRSGKAKGKLFSAQLNITESAQGCEVSIDLDLPMKFALAKGMIQKSLQKQLDKSLKEV